MKSDTLIAVEWLWSLRGKNIWLAPSVLTAENKDPASPNLTIVEAISVFKNLHEKGLIFPAVTDGRPLFYLHESKIQEWNTFIENLKNEKNLPAQKFPDEITSGQEKNQQQEHIAPTNLKGIVESKSILDWDNFFKLIGAIGIASWTVQEWIIPHDKIFLFITIVCFVADVFFIVFHKFLPQKRPLIVLGWIIYFVCIGLIYRNPSEAKQIEAQTKSYPHFRFRLISSTSPNEVAELTNSFLNFPNLGGNMGFLGGAVFVPRPMENSNVVLNFFVINDGPDDASDVEITFSFPKNVGFVPHPDWNMMLDDNFEIMPSGETNKLESVQYTIPFILEGNGKPFPPIAFTNSTLATPPNFGVENGFTIMARARGTQAQAIGAALLFTPYFSNVLHKPFVLPVVRNTNGQSIIWYNTKKVLTEMQ